MDTSYPNPSEIAKHFMKIHHPLFLLQPAFSSTNGLFAKSWKHHLCVQLRMLLLQHPQVEPAFD
jgi:hypothetical protein